MAYGVRHRVFGRALALLLTTAAAGAGAATYHVAPNGDDAGPGSAAQPWRSIGKANATLTAGDTVLLHAGRYADPIRPRSDGDGDSSRIVYRAFGDGDVELIGFSETDSVDGGALALGAKKYVTVSGRADGDAAAARRIRLLPQRDVGMLGNVCGSEGVVIENVYARCPDSDRSCSRGIAFCLNYWPGSYETRYNVLRNSTLIGHSSKSDSPSDYTEDLVTLAHRAHHNLIENSVLENARHTVIYADSPLAHSNVIRNNIVRNPAHTAVSIWSAGVALPDGARHLLENNYLQGSGNTPDPDGGPGSPLQIGSDELTVRYNVVTRAGAANAQHFSVAGITGATSTSYGAPYFSTDSRFYNNTIVKNRGVAVGMFDFSIEPVDLGRHRFVNNIIFGSDSEVTGKRLVMYHDGGFATADGYIRNVFGNPGGGAEAIFFNQHHGDQTFQGAVATLRAPQDPQLLNWRGTANAYDADPGFVDYAADDFRLRTDSPYVDSGAALTAVAAADSGSGAVLRVDDARFFHAEASGFPDWMGVRRDWIAVGASIADAATVEVVAVDDANGTLTLARSLQRRPGDLVWLWRDSDGSEVIRGAAPDVGAFETARATPPPPPPENFRAVED